MTGPADAARQRLDSSDLRVALEESLSRRSGTQHNILGLKRWPWIYSASSPIEELEVRLEGGKSLRLLFKDLSWPSMLESARRVKPMSLYDPLREIETYRKILAHNRLGTATCYGVVIGHRSDRYGLFLEKVPGMELYQVGDLGVWQQVARWLAGMHTRFVEETGSLTEMAPLLTYDARFYRLWIQRAQKFLDQPLQPDDVRRGIRWLAGRYDRAVEYLLTLPVTFIHGEFHASNVLVQENDGEQLRICPIDWEMAAVGPGPIDLAALVAGGWTEREKVALSVSYRDALGPDKGWVLAPDAFSTMLDYCQLHLAVQWLGWFGRRRPFQGHAQDWLSEALRLAEKLEL